MIKELEHLPENLGIMVLFGLEIGLIKGIGEGHDTNFINCGQYGDISHFLIMLKYRLTF